jgi:hypothetical protein
VQRQPSASTGRRTENATVPVVEHADYLDEDWRSVLSFLQSAQADLPSEAFLARLRILSLDQTRLVLPPLTNLFEVRAYGHLLGVNVSLQHVSLDEIKHLLSAGIPVLIRRQDQWMCLVGFDPAWRTMLYYDYGRETERLRQRHRQEEAKAMLSDSQARQDARLRVLRNSLIEEMPEEDLVRTLTAQHGLVAVPRAGDVARDITVESFLLGELAFEARDPFLALHHYTRSVGSDLEAPWVLPYVHVARLTIEDQPVEILERRLLPRELEEEFAQWRQAPAHEELLAHAKDAFERRDLATLPDRVVERLAKTLQANVPEEQPLLIRCYEILRQRHPEHPVYLIALSEAYHHARELEPLAQTYRKLCVLEPTAVMYQFRLVETLLHLQRPAQAQAVLRKARGRVETPADRSRYLALSGRTARALNQLPRAVRLLRQALESNLADPELRFELAMALEGLGHRQQALREWQWVAFASVNPEQRQLAQHRVGTSVGGSR